MSKLVKYGLGVVVVGALIAAFLLLPVNRWVLDLVASVREAGGLGALAYAAVYIIATVLFLPGSLLTLGAGFAYGPLWGTLLISPVSVLAATLAFVLGRSALREWIARRMEALSRLAAIDRAIGESGFKIVLLLRLSPIFPFNLLNYALGLTRVRLRDYVPASFLGMLPGTFLYVYLGSLVTSASELLRGERPAAGDCQDLERLASLLARREIFAPATAALLAGPRTSVIVPVLNEEARIGRQLAALAAMKELHEVIVVDGGSADRTVEIARLFPDVRVMEAQMGRAKQMNAGAAIATGDVLLFLHADVSLPGDATRWIRETLADTEVVAGAFHTWTVPDAGRSWLAPLLHLADLRSRYNSLPYGDQALFVRKDAFRDAGGFPDLPLMEDVALSRALRRAGRIRTVPASVRVSGRRFLARPVYYTLLVNLFPLLYRLGVPPRVLASLYGNPR